MRRFLAWHALYRTHSYSSHFLADVAKPIRKIIYNYMKRLLKTNMTMFCYNLFVRDYLFVLWTGFRPSSFGLW